MQLDLSNKPVARTALEMAKKHHAGIERKFDGRPYISHPIEVAEILLSHGVTDQHMLAAALLHDCAEDENIEGKRMAFAHISASCGERVHRMVADLTRTANQRKSDYDRQLSVACHNTKTIKAADMISNMRRLHETPVDFWERQLTKRDKGLSVLMSNGWQDTYDVGAAARETLELQKIRFLEHLQANHERFEAEQRANAAEIDALAAEIMREAFEPVFA